MKCESNTEACLYLGSLLREKINLIVREEEEDEVFPRRHD